MTLFLDLATYGVPLNRIPASKKEN